MEEVQQTCRRKKIRIVGENKAFGSRLGAYI